MAANVLERYITILNILFYLCWLHFCRLSSHVNPYIKHKNTNRLTAILKILVSRSAIIKYPTEKHADRLPSA